ncbi:MAG TPA: V-type ATPase subunit [Spirochaetales bacterium]|nr:V-type ATPase subunit [Spirochaetales bacterium]HRY54744.1 V-type ATPase subunit [Spirochaetia bacterium]HRZ65928.1 V-type ATPase subunit [Spirochaetia bacterium]
MADRFELSYVYARVCGSLSRAFIGGKAVELARVGRIPELWRALFQEPAPNLPEASLVAEAERRAVAESLEGFGELARRLRSDEPFFEALRRKSEFARVKRILLAARNGSSLPPSEDPGLAPGFREASHPRIADMFAGGRYSWIDEESAKDLPAVENRLDRQYYEELWAELIRLPARKAGALRSLILEEAELQNVVWALRLARYYGMGRAEIEGKLVSLKGADASSSALEALGFKLDQRADWAGWAWEELLGGSEDRGGGFILDLRDLEGRARRRVYRSVKRALHLHPFTYTPLYCYFKIKEYETAAIIGVIEGLHLGAPFAEMASFAAGLAGGSA